MGRINWLEKLNWNIDQVEDLRMAGFSYIRQGKYEIALPFFEALAVLVPDSAYDSQTLGALYLQLGDPQKAIKHLEYALKLETDHSPTLLNFTKALFMLGRTHEALKLAAILSKEPNQYISNVAKALILAYE